MANPWKNVVVATIVPGNGFGGPKFINLNFKDGNWDAVLVIGYGQFSVASDDLKDEGGLL